MSGSKTAVVVACAVGALVLGFGWSQYRSSDSSPEPVITRATSSAPLPRLAPSTAVSSAPAPTADVGCTDEGYERPLAMVDANGLTVGDLVMCTDDAHSHAQVTNASTSRVWFLQGGGGYRYWGAEEDVKRPLATILFRAGLRSSFREQDRTPYLTLKPGLTATFPRSPEALAFAVDPAEQAAWQSAVLQAQAVDQVRAQYGDQVESGVQELISGDSKSRAAAVTCVSEAFSLGTTIGDATVDPSQVMLTDVFGAYGNVTECSQATKEAAAAERARKRPPILSFEATEEASKVGRWTSLTDETLRYAAQEVVTRIHV